MVDVSLHQTGAKFSNARVSGSFSDPQVPAVPTSYFVKRMDYDHADRLIDTWHTLNGGPEILLSHNTYNALGQLVDKKLHSTLANAADARQSIDYRYNIRGWLTSINNATLSADDANDDSGDFFGMNLDYNDNEGALVTVPPSLVSWYKLDGNADDAGPLGVNGAVTGATATADAQGNSNKAMAFNGPSTYIKLNGTEDGHAFIQNTGRFTIAAFIKLNNVNTRAEILSNGGSSGLKGFRFMYETTGGSYGTHQLRFNTIAGARTSAITLGEPYTINDTNWHHVAVVGDGNNIQFYVDGVADGAPQTLTARSTGSSTYPTLIAATVNPGNPTPLVGMQGSIDEVMVFNAPLGVEDIQKLEQHTPTNTAHGTGQYNGNISAVRWSKDQGLGEVKENAYQYSYDPMNRLSGALFRNKDAAGWQTPQNNGFSENNLTYDLNGNIRTLHRNDERTMGLMDQLVYDYGAAGGNQLSNVRDYGDAVKGFAEGNPSSGDEYVYDKNGNMVVDENKSITTKIVYNHLNLPEEILKYNNTLWYAYDALGTKHAQIVQAYTQRHTTEYAGPWVFENNVMQLVQHDEGRIVLAKKELVYKNTCDDLTGLTATTGALIANETINGQTYLVVTEQAGSSSRTGMMIAEPVTVTEGERYLYRVKGYWPAAPFSMVVSGISNADSSTVDVLRGSVLLRYATNETWTESMIVVPPGISTLNFGLLTFKANTNKGDVYVNDIEIYKLDSDAPEYQYHLKDHLGNVRLTFTTKTTGLEYTAGFEAANRQTEASDFENYPSGGEINGVAGHAHTGTSSHWLNGGHNGQVGVAKNFAVMPGDQLKIEAYASFEEPSETPTDFSNFVPSLLAAFSLQTPAPGEVGTAASGISAFANWETSADGNANENDPVKAFVSIVLFDKNHQVIDVAYRASRGSGELISQGYTVKEPGYAYLFVSNEHPTRMDIYFDDVTITHTPSPVIQVDDYYPFGLTFNSYQREAIKGNDYLYNGKERQDELGLGWLDYGARMYMPDIGRWGATDPSVDLYYDWTPFNYCANNPILLIDPNGKEWFFHRAKGEDEASWHWHEGDKYNTGIKDQNGNDIIIDGVDAVVIYRSDGEQLGAGNNLYGDGAKLADVWVLGPDGANDIQRYEGFSISSDGKRFGVVAEGVHAGNYDKDGKSGSLESNWAVEGRGRVPDDDGFNPAHPERGRTNGYLTGVFVHASNKSGSAGIYQKKYPKEHPKAGQKMTDSSGKPVYGGISEGCLLIAPGRAGDGADWARFKSQMNGAQDFALDIKRSLPRKPRKE
jgi:RHS repeat-associated protein